MIVAIYARKSTAQEVGEDAKSVTRQVENAKRFALQQGWSLDERYIFVDDGISGAETERLAARARMIALASSGAFQVVVMQAQDRFSRRDGDEAFGELKQLARQVQVWFYASRERFTFGDFKSNITGFLGAEFAAEYRRVIAQKTHEAHVRRASLGQVTGGSCFGYTNVRLDTGGVTRTISEPEAAVIREIFERCARGQGFRVIAHALNASGAPCPRPRKGRVAGWAPSSVREALYRESYRGTLVYNKTKKRNIEGDKAFAKRPESEWIHTSVPALRIVSEEAWAAAHDRLSSSREAYIRTNGGRLWGKPSNGIESKYLLTGLLECAVCHGGFFVTSRTNGKQRKYVYGCTTFHRKGHTVCENNRLVALLETDDLVMEALREELLDPVVVAYALHTTIAALHSPPADLAERRTRLEARVSTIATEIGRLTAAIAAGGQLEALVAGMRDREQEQHRLRRELADLAPAPALLEDDALEATLTARVAEWKAMAARNVAQGRQVIRKLLRGRVTVKPLPDGTCELSGRADYGKLFTGILGLQQRWCARQDSNLWPTAPEAVALSS